MSALHKSLWKGGVKKLFCLYEARNFRCTFTLSITFKAFDSPDTL